MRGADRPAQTAAGTPISGATERYLCVTGSAAPLVERRVGVFQHLWAGCSDAARSATVELRRLPGRAGAFGQVHEDARHVGLCDQNLTRLGTLVAGDDSATLEHVDQPARTRIPKPQTPLQHRGRCRAHRGDETDRLLQQGVLIRVETIVGATARAGVAVILTSSSSSSR